MKITIGNNIKRLRIAKGITQEELSTAMNVTCAAVSKWEREETYPDITLLQPLAYYFGVSLDELMGYDQEKVQAEIDEAIASYKNYSKNNYKKAREIITAAYHEYPNDYRIMYCYMWNIAGDQADNDSKVLIARKEELIRICEKIIAGCTDEKIRLGAWNMRAKILHAEGKTEKALEIYNTKFADWYTTKGQKREQLFSKDTDEYYFQVQKNMYELADFAADKLGRKVFFDSSLSMEEKTKHALLCGDLLLGAFEQTGEAFFLITAKSFLARMENDMVFRGGTDEQVTAIMEKNLQAASMLTEYAPLWQSYYDRCPSDEQSETLITREVRYRANAKEGRRAELLKNAAYVAVLNRHAEK